MARGTIRHVPRSETRLMAEGPAVTRADTDREGSRSLALGRGVSVVLFALSCVLLGVFLLDARFRVRTVSVEGATLIDPGQIIADCRSL